MDVLGVLDAAAEIMGRDGHTEVPNGLLNARELIAGLLQASERVAAAWRGGFRFDAEQAMPELDAALAAIEGAH